MGVVAVSMALCVGAAATGCLGLGFIYNPETFWGLGFVCFLLLLGGGAGGGFLQWGLQFRVWGAQARGGVVAVSRAPPLAAVG